MNTETKRNVLEKIKEYDSIVVARHSRPDGDAIGSSAGLREVLRASFPGKDVRLIACDDSDYLSFLNVKYDEADETFLRSSLALVLDTATADRVSDDRVFLCAETVKIDHHIDVKPFGDISWIEKDRSSVCEMIADFCMTFPDELKVTPEAAKLLYTGMVTDSGRFRYSSTSGDTMRCGAFLLDFGIDTDTLFANLYLDDYSELVYKAYIYTHIKLTENGVAYIFVSKAMQERFSLSIEQASNCVSYLDSLRGSIIWLAFIENPDSTIRVRLRSRFVTVNALAEKYGGGGHACASGATVENRKMMKSLISDADELIGDYKNSRKGWL